VLGVARPRRRATSLLRVGSYVPSNGYAVQSTLLARPLSISSATSPQRLFLSVSGYERRGTSIVEELWATAVFQGLVEDAARARVDQRGFLVPFRSGDGKRKSIENLTALSYTPSVQVFPPLRAPSRDLSQLPN
jgi:hypothetical protein